MAARTLRPFHQEEVKSKIQCSQLINFVQEYALTGEYRGSVDISPSRVVSALKLLEFRIAKAIPDAVTNNLQANTMQALSSINQAQLLAMAKEMLANQGIILEHAATVDNSSVDKLVDTNVSHGLLGGVGMSGVGGVVGVPNPPVAQTSSEIYPDQVNMLPDELG